NLATPRLCANTRHAGSKNAVPRARPLNSVHTTTISRTGPTWCHVPLSCPPPFLTFPPFLPGSQPGETLPDWTPDRPPPDAGTPCSWRSAVAGAGHDNAAGLRLRIGGIAHRNGCASVAGPRFG